MSRTLTCSIELSKSAGVTLTVTDEGGGITQTLVMNGTAICATVKGAEGSTTITLGEGDIQLEVAGPQARSTVRQIQDRVVIRCRSLEVEADEIQMKSSGDTRHQVGGALTVKSEGDMALTTSGRCSVSSTGDMNLDTQAALTATAARDAKLSASNAAIEAATRLSAGGGSSVAISAPTIDVSATMALDLSAALATLSGEASATVSGKLVNVEGDLIKLG